MPNNTKDGWREQLTGVFGAALIFYLLPAVIIFIVNFLKLVVFGYLNCSEFMRDWVNFSFERVNIFYQGIVEWFSGLLSRLTS